MNHRQGVQKKATLTAEEIDEIKQLTVLCNEYEHLHLRIIWPELARRSGTESNDFLYYEDDKLVSYLALSSWGDEEREVVGMVHPECRRNGIFRQLLSTAEEEAEKRGIKSLLLVCEHASSSGRAFVDAIRAPLAFSEHEMVLTNFKEPGTFDDRLYFRLASTADLDVLIAVSVAAFDDTPENARSLIVKRLQDPGCQTYLCTLGGENVGCDEPVGVLRLEDFGDVIGIYGFGIVPDYRGRGYSKQMLAEAIRETRAKSQKPIILDVDTNNTKALGLYLSNGFQINTTYGYYRVEI